MRTDFSLASDILRSKAFSVYPIGEVYDAISKNTGMNFDAISALLKRTPLFIDGQLHKELRAAMATRMAACRDKQHALMRAKVVELVNSHVKSGSKLEITNAFSLPIFHSFVSSLMSVSPETQRILDGMPRAIDPELQFRSRIDLNQKIISVMPHISEDEDLALEFVALTMLGHDSFVGAISASLYKAIEDNSGRRLCDFDWPSNLTITGVPITDRIATTNYTNGSFFMERGDRVRIYFQTLHLPDGAKSDALLYGKGAHLCLGRQISQYVWHAIISQMGKLTCRANVLSYVRRKPDFIFNYPAESKVYFYD